MLLDHIIDSKNKIKLMRELSLHENWEYSINELVKNTGIHRVRISSLIKELADLGAIKIKTKGRVRLVSINKGNYFVKNILIELFKKEKNLAIDIASEVVKDIKRDKNVISIILFGSSIKERFTFKSDIDIMVIYSKDEHIKNIDKIIEEYDKHGLLISYDTISVDEFKKLFREKEASIVSLVKDNKTLYGKNVLEMI
ncbi:MAG: nucleotidyltransferase domain-containing protein [Candidatus Woesearchaeota archaeon]|nr:nucleotidyltransferase domain-containing protein [Candidatus Woesearchaeota archaeon]